MRIQIIEGAEKASNYVDGAGKPLSEGNILCGGSVEARFDRCMAEHGGNTNAVHFRANISHMCKEIILHEFTINEKAAQNQYTEATELFPEYKTVILEIRGDEADHEQKFKQMRASL